MFLLSELVRNCGFKVAVTGDGADEFLGGYDIFKEAAIRRFWAKRPQSVMRPRLFRRVYGDIQDLSATSTAFLSVFFGRELTQVDSPYYSHLVRWRNNARTRRFLSPAVMDEVTRDTSTPPFSPELPPQFMTWGSLERAQYLESTIFLSQYLLSAQGDRVAMAHSVESRLPFLDHRLVEFCNRLPANQKLRGLKDKYLLRRLAQEFLPAEVWQRAKRPYRAPIYRSFFSKPTPDYVRELLSPAYVRAAGLFIPDAVDRLVKKATVGAPLSETDDMALAGILSAHLTYHQFVTNFAPAQPLAVGECDMKICAGHAAAA
jgi:asparagine synthase (glutamine-hydrolysing)